MGRIDLHLHSSASDGRLDPAAVVARAAERGVETIALCDHDTVSGVAPAREAGRRLGVRVVPGVELTCYHSGRSLHLLGYGFDPADERLLADLEHRRDVRRRHLRRILDRLAELGLPLAEHEVIRRAGSDTAGRPHVAAALVDAGHVPDIQAAFDQYLRKGRPAYFVPAEPQSPYDAIELLHELGAVAVLAHPAMDRGHELIRPLAEAGLDGLEAYHPSSRNGLARVFGDDARQHGLLLTGGSDNHGPDRPPDVGEVPVPDELLTELDAAIAARAGDVGR